MFAVCKKVKKINRLYLKYGTLRTYSVCRSRNFQTFGTRIIMTKLEKCSLSGNAIFASKLNEYEFTFDAQLRSEYLSLKYFY